VHDFMFDSAHFDDSPTRLTIQFAFKLDQLA
jgi:hypothetical protein